MSVFERQLKSIGLVLIAVCTVSIYFDRIVGPLAPFVNAQVIDQSPLATATLFPTVTPTFTPALPTATPTITLTPTPTATPGNVAQFERPVSGDAISGFTMIRGTALIDRYRKYDIHISASGKEDWHWVTTKYDIVRGGDLHLLDTAQYADGHYDLRLRAIDDVGTYNETFLRNVEIRNQNPPTPTPVVNELGTPIVSPLDSPLPTPTPTLDTRVRIPGAQGFYAPDEFAVLQGVAPIVATVNNLGFNFFDRYELYISNAGMEEWRHLITSEEQHWQDTIYLLNTALFEDGYYDLRLRIVYEDSNYSEYHLRNLRIANRGHPASDAAKHPVKNGIHQPRSGQRVSGVVDFIGTAIDPDFQRWELYWSPSGKESWSFLISDQEAVVRGLLARLDLSQLPMGHYDFRMRLVRKDQNYDEYFVTKVLLSMPGD